MAGTMACATSSRSWAIRIIFTVCGSALATQALPVWFQISSWVVRHAPNKKLDASIDFALGVLPDIFAGEWNRAMKNLHSQKA